MIALFSCPTWQTRVSHCRFGLRTQSFWLCTNIILVDKQTNNIRCFTQSYAFRQYGPVFHLLFRPREKEEKNILQWFARTQRSSYTRSQATTISSTENVCILNTHSSATYIGFMWEHFIECTMGLAPIRDDMMALDNHWQNTTEQTRKKKLNTTTD